METNKDLVAGGQGRSSADLIEDVTVLVAVGAMMALVLAIGFWLGR